MTYDTAAGPITQISFAEFLDLVPETVLPPVWELFRFDTQVEHLDTFMEVGAPFPDKEVCSERLLLLSEDRSSHTFRQHLILQAKYTHLPEATLEEFVGTAATDQLIRFGNPKYLVQVVAGHYLMANPKDFLIVRSDRGVGLACLSQYRTILYTVAVKTSEDK